LDPVFIGLSVKVLSRSRVLFFLSTVAEVKYERAIWSVRLWSHVLFFQSFDSLSSVWALVTSSETVRLSARLRVAMGSLSSRHSWNRIICR
jgi:hypothetical protein